MSASIIWVEHLGKKYNLQHRTESYRYSTFREALTEVARKAFRFGIPNRPREGSGRGAHSEEFWALKDVSFEVKQGEAVGIIGRNGAGKSTLLKVLSRITQPTTGRVRIRGHVASLLEVGTGFHPELTGRENIFLNGAILGMGRTEIQRKFDDIVAFAEVEQFLDTPVKRYSSGMYVRLAFAIAAHLEPEIIIVDEVLAVGDSSFQKKCLGKMSSMSSGGRTVLFVSHNMAAVKSLTRRGLVLSQGRAAFDGGTEAAIQYYIQSVEGAGKTSHHCWGRGVHTAIQAVRILDSSGKPTTQYEPGRPLRIEVEFETDGDSGLSLELFLTDAFRSNIGMASTYQFHGMTLPRQEGVYRCHLEIEPLWLASGSYICDARTSVINVNWDHSVENACEFEVPFSNPMGLQFDFRQASGYGPLALVASRPIYFDPVQREQHIEAGREAAGQTAPA